MRITRFTFGSIEIDGTVYEHDVVIDRGKVYKRKKKESKRYRDDFGHTPVSLRESIPWKCRRLVIGTGADGRLPVMKGLHREAREREVELIIVPTPDAIGVLNRSSKKTNAVLHITC